MPLPLIPQFEPEVVFAAVRKKKSMDAEKISTISLKSIDIYGVMLSSRYNKANEYKIMTEMIEGVDVNLRSFINSIWCDSKATACYSVILNPCKKYEAISIAYQLQDASGGHNGISISGVQGGRFDLDPHWDWGEEDD